MIDNWFGQCKTRESSSTIHQLRIFIWVISNKERILKPLNERYPVVINRIENDREVNGR